MSMSDADIEFQNALRAAHWAFKHGQIELQLDLTRYTRECLARYARECDNPELSEKLVAYLIASELEGESNEHV